MKIKAVASDLDGTLLKHGWQGMDPRVFDYIRELKKQGIVFIAASGRQYSNLRNLFAPVKDEIAYICENGSQVYYNDELIGLKEMDREIGRCIIRDVLAWKDAEVLVSGLKTHYVKPKSDWYVPFMRDVVGNHVTIMEDIENIDVPFTKISFYEREGFTDNAWWHAKYDAYANLAVGAKRWMDIQPFGVHKAVGMEMLLERMGISPEETVAFGDAENDREMLQYVGMPCTMDTAADHVRVLGKRVVSDVADELEAILLGKYDLL